MDADYLLPISAEELEAIHLAPGLQAKLTRTALNRWQTEQRIRSYYLHTLGQHGPTAQQMEYILDALFDE